MIQTTRLIAIWVGMIFLLVTAIPVQAASFTAGTAPELINAINDANANSMADTITLTADITLTAVADTTILGDNGLPSITSEITIEGAGFTIARDASVPSFRIFYVAGSGNLTLNNVTVSNGVATGTFPAGDGGGIFNNGTLTLTGSTLSDNSANFGGGIFNVNGTLTLTGSTLSDNSANNGGGGIYNRGTLTLTGSTLSRNSAATFGGGIFNTSNDTVALNNNILSDNSANNGGGIFNNGTLTLTGSTLSDNSAADDGGGILNADTVTLNNSTLSDNSANFGGGIFNDEYGTLTLSNSTLSGNSANIIGGGIYNDSTVTLSNSIIANSPAGGDYLDLGGATATGLNIVETGLATGPNVINNDPDLGPLADNGGPTFTHALVSGSPAIDASTGTATTADQRGAPAVGTRDIGAYEFNGVVPTVSFSIDQTTLTEGGTITQATVTITVTNYSEPFDVLFTFTGDVSTADYTTTYTNPISITSSTPQTFTIDIVNDSLVEGTEALNLELLVIGAADITGSNPQSITFEDSLVTVTASDAAAENPLDTGQFIVDLGGGNATGNIITVTYTIGGSATPTSDYTALSGSVQVPNGQQTATIDVTPVDDSIAEGAETVVVTLAGTDLTGLNVDTSPAEVTIQDDDAPGITVAPTTLAISEPAGSSIFELTLNTDPTAAVDVPLSSSEPSVCTVSPAQVTLSDTTTPASVTVTAVNDSIDNPGNQRICTIITGDPTSGDSFYNDLTAAGVVDVPVTVQDDDGAGVFIQPLNITFGAGASGFYTVVLTSQPSTDVTVTAYANSVCEMFPGSRIFTPQNWNQPQEFAVGSTLAGECVINHVVASGGAYDDISAANVRVTVTDGAGGSTPPGEDAGETGIADNDPLMNVKQLPTTGESPLWRDWLALALMLIGGAGLLALWKRPGSA